jgi:hypothetical protein
MDGWMGRGKPPNALRAKGVKKKEKKKKKKKKKSQMIPWRWQ